MKDLARCARNWVFMINHPKNLQKYLQSIDFVLKQKLPVLYRKFHKNPKFYTTIKLNFKKKINKLPKPAHLNEESCACPAANLPDTEWTGATLSIIPYIRSLYEPANHPPTPLLSHRFVSCKYMGKQTAATLSGAGHPEWNRRVRRWLMVSQPPQVIKLIQEWGEALKGVEGQVEVRSCLWGLSRRFAL